MKQIMLFVFLTFCGVAAEQDGFVPLFNGRDLKGWINVNCAPETWTVKDGVIHCTGQPTGALRTPRHYENFILELEWRHLQAGGNSGIFIWGTPIAAPGVPFLRGIEVQVLDHGFNVPGKNEWYTTHGDVFPIHGASMKPFGRHHGERSFPSEERSKGSPEWNHYRIVCTNGVLRLHVNGKEVSGGQECHYRKGYLALESEGAPVEFRNVRIKELPSSGAPPDMTAPNDMGWSSLFNGLDLRGWKINAGDTIRWHAGGGSLSLKEGPPNPHPLWTERDFGDAEFIVDCRLAKGITDKQPPVPTLQLRGIAGNDGRVPLAGATPEKYQRFTITVQGRSVLVKRNLEEGKRFELPATASSPGPLGITDCGGAVQFMNLYARDLN